MLLEGVTPAIARDLEIFQKWLVSRNIPQQSLTKVDQRDIHNGCVWTSRDNCGNRRRRALTDGILLSIAAMLANIASTKLRQGENEDAMIALEEALLVRKQPAFMCRKVD